MSKCVVLGITGSIAAYKAAEITSRLKKNGVDVRIILTKAGAEFITPLTLETLSANPVVTDMFLRDTPWEVEHISLAKRADAFLVAPATANFIGKYASGIADDMLTTTIMAAVCPVLIAPAMNVNMYDSDANKSNMELLKRRGCMFIEPDEGFLACGDVGKGRLADPAKIVDIVMRALYPKRDLEGIRILVTAGPTREEIDPVRYITNHSSGKMGFCIAQAAARRGADVTLISGPVALKTPDGVKRVDIVSSSELYDAVNSHYNNCDILIMAAAPADFTPSRRAVHKIKKRDLERMSLELLPARDILALMGAKKRERVLIGFAAETENLLENAVLKLEKKHLDMIVANDITAPGAGFQSDTNSVTLILSSGTVKDSGLLSKVGVADWLLDETVDYIASKRQ